MFELKNLSFDENVSRLILYILFIILELPT
jgi:hypothetical protein